MTEEKLAEIKSHVQPMDRTCFDVRRAFEDRDALIAEVDRLRAALPIAYDKGRADEAFKHHR